MCKVYDVLSKVHFNIEDRRQRSTESSIKVQVKALRTQHFQWREDNDKVSWRVMLDHVGPGVNNTLMKVWSQNSEG